MTKDSDNETLSENATNVVSIPLRPDAPEFQRLFEEVNSEGLLNPPPLPEPLLPKGIAKRMTEVNKVRRKSGLDALTLGQFLKEEEANKVK